MITVDFIGLILSIALVGLRYPLSALGAAIVYAAGQVIMAVFLHGNIESIVAAGLFGSAVVSNISGLGQTLAVLFSGSLANWLVWASTGKFSSEGFERLINPAAASLQPIAVTNFRFALLSTLISVWKLFFQG